MADAGARRALGAPAPELTQLSLRALNRATLARQLLLAREAIPVPEALERVGGLQAQEPKPPFAALWSRIEGFAREDLLAALHDRTAVRATLMRATLHTMSAADVAELRPALQPMLTQALRVLGDRAEGLDSAGALKAARKALKDGPRTAAELRDALGEAFPDADVRALGYAVRTQLPLVMVPTEDRWGFPASARFTMAEEWLGRPLKNPGPEAVVLRHLAAFGPATAADVQTWSGLGGLKPVLEALRPKLATFRDEGGRELFDLPDAPRPDEDVPAPARFLPEFDSLMLAHADRTRVVAEEHRKGLVTKNLRVRAVFLWDGFAAGTWTSVRKGKAAEITAVPFARLPKGATAALREEGEALLAFLEPDASARKVTVTRPGAPT
ncbi:MAG: hypothetical protein QOD86_1449 [Miltoncostaeaceae bacterium]|nr:hypothetical protein [Miltoncostaeaceae bacterium]